MKAMDNARARGGADMVVFAVRLNALGCIPRWAACATLGVELSRDGLGRD
jgi:hypothetical protein